MHYNGMSTHQFILYYASAIHKHTHIFKPFEDSKPTGLKVDIAIFHSSSFTYQSMCKSLLPEEGLTLRICTCFVLSY